MTENQDTKEETIDLKALILKYSQYWYYFLLSILFFVFIAFLNNRYTTPEYSVSTTLLIRDDNNTQLGAENLLEGLELFSGRSNIENEIVILKSFMIADKVVSNLNLGVSYFQQGVFKKNDLFQKNPFKVHIDSNHLQIVEVEFDVDIVDENSFKLLIKENNISPFNLNTQLKHKDKEFDLKIDEIYQFNAVIKSENYSFVISKTNHFNYEKILKDNKTYSFIIHTPYNIINHVSSQLNINPVNIETSILRLNIKGRAPHKNIAILNDLTSEYINNGLSDKNIMAVNTIHFIDEQLEVIQDSLTRIENKIKAFKELNPNLDLVDKEFGTFFQKQKLDNTLSEQSVNIKYYQSLLSYLKDDMNANSIVSPTSMGISNPELNGLINQLLQLYARKGELQLTTTDKNPTYQTVLSQIKHTKNTIIENVSNLISSAKIYEEDLKRRVNTFNSKISALPEAEKNYLILKRKHTYNEQTAIYLQQKKYEASLAKAGTESDHKVIDPARLDSKIPIKPKRSLAYFIAILLGLFSPIAFISLRDFFSNTISSKSDLQNATRIPILGLIGHSDKGTSLVVDTASKSIIAESFRSVRTNIQYIAAEKDKKVITITSSIGGEGKTFTAMNLAAIFALSGHKTILIGGDLRKPKIHEDFNLKDDTGLSTYLINKSLLQNVISKTEIDSLEVIVSGPTPPNPAELLDSPKMQELITELNKTYDFVIIDTPPIGLVTDGVILMQHADINLYVVRHEYSKAKSLSIINNLYEQEQIKNVHVIINDFKHSNTDYGYGYGYGYGTSGYGYYEEE